MMSSALDRFPMLLNIPCGIKESTTQKETSTHVEEIPSSIKTSHPYDYYFSIILDNSPCDIVQKITIDTLKN